MKGRIKNLGIGAVMAIALYTGQGCATTMDPAKRERACNHAINWAEDHCILIYHRGSKEGYKGCYNRTVERFAPGLDCTEE